MIPILQSLKSASLARTHVTVAATAPEVDGSRYPWAIGQWFMQPLSASSKPKGNGEMTCSSQIALLRFQVWSRVEYISIAINSSKDQGVFPRLQLEH